MAVFFFGGAIPVARAARESRGFKAKREWRGATTYRNAIGSSHGGVLLYAYFLRELQAV